MRRSEREIKDRASIEAIIRKSAVCHLGLCDAAGQPYVVPLCFGYEDGAVYFHAPGTGRKIEMIEANPRVCVQFDCDAEIVEGETACAWTMRYRSAIGFGTASRVDDEHEKRKALALLMRQYSPEPFDFTEEQVARVTILKVVLQALTGKQSGY